MNSTMTTNIWSSSKLGKRWEPPTGNSNDNTTAKRRKISPPPQEEQQPTTVSRSFATAEQAKQFLANRKRQQQGQQQQPNSDNPTSTVATHNDKRKREEEPQTVLEAGEIAEPETAKRRRIVSPSPDHAHDVYTQEVTESFLRKEVSDKVTGSGTNDKARLHVVDWLLSLRDKYGLLEETVHLAVAVLDRYLTKQQQGTTPEDPQLIGFACLWMAIKYEEQQTVKTSKFPNGLGPFCAKAAKGAFSERDVINMEYKVLRTLDFNIAMPTASTFLNLSLEASSTTVDAKTVKRARFILDTSLLSARLVTDHLPSQLAGAALGLAQGKSDDGQPAVGALFKEYNLLMENPNLRRGWRRVRLQHNS